MKKILVSPAHSNRIRLARAVAGPPACYPPAVAWYSGQLECRHAWQWRAGRPAKCTAYMPACMAMAGRLWIVVIAAAMIAIFSATATGQLMTECCVDCHVVHAWQDKTERDKAAERAAERAVVTAAATAKRPTPTGLYASVLEEACEACHADAESHTLSKAGLNTVPIVKNKKEPEVLLAGGNFYYESGKAHFEKAGGACTSCHRDVRHHATKAGYRFLGPEIEGVGDPQYEYGEGHNIYKSGDQYCSACHAGFCGTDNQKSEGSWIRHPTNTLVPMEGQYETYVYRKDIPVGYPDPSSPDRASAHVMCISCHRPHGTPNPYLLRWDYKALGPRDGKNDNGCFACHRQKAKREM